VECFAVIGVKGVVLHLAIVNQLATGKSIHWAVGDNDGLI
jgi:hypothetical protein